MNKFFSSEKIELIPGVLEAKLVLQQLHCNGILEGIKICRKGFPTRLSHTDFLQRYSCLASVSTMPVETAEQLGAKCTAVLEHVGLDMDLYRVGTNKCLFKTGALGRLDESRDGAVEKKILVVQNYFRRFLAYNRFMTMYVNCLALRLLQRNLRVWLGIREWPWLKLVNGLSPVIEFMRQEVGFINSNKKLLEIMPGRK